MKASLQMVWNISQLESFAQNTFEKDVLLVFLCRLENKFCIPRHEPGREIYKKIVA